MKIDIPNFKTKKELFSFLIENKEILLTQKKSAVKYADGLSIDHLPKEAQKSITKAEGTQSGESDMVKTRTIINTTNILDSHGDVHIKGIWNKSLKENKRILHVQEHKSNEFDKIIASGEDLKASVKTYSWKELGYDAEGETQALVFDSNVRKERNPFMFEQYSKGYVNNHSVGMRYVKLELAVNDKDYEKEKDFWDKNINLIVNKQEAEKNGYFWVVQEAKVIEGSAVPLGSNPITPTLNIKSEPTILDLINKMDTQKSKAAESTFSILEAINKTSINIKNF
tara:strand:- start:3952 stop:4800 length:849 start_codon:yes stop_codon:yes gene_type:complete